MKLRSVQYSEGIKVEALTAKGWLRLDALDTLDALAESCRVKGDLATDLLAVLQLGKAGWASLAGQLDSVTATVSANVQPVLPFSPKSFRDFMLFEQHVIDSTRGYVQRFLPKLYPITRFYERITGKVFPKFKPHALWYRQPIYYFGNHMNFLTEGETIEWPAYSNALDYELELGAILAKPLCNATKEEARDAIGGFVVLNDVSARDCQKDEMESGFGPQRAKHFVNVMSAIVVTADEFLPNLSNLNGSILINDKRVATCDGRKMQYELPEAIAFLSQGEALHPGELFGTGTIPGGTGLENNHWVKRGDKISLEIDGLDCLSNYIEPN